MPPEHDVTSDSLIPGILAVNSRHRAARREAVRRFPFCFASGTARTGAAVSHIHARQHWRERLPARSPTGSVGARTAVGWVEVSIGHDGTGTRAGRVAGASPVAGSPAAF